MSVFVNVQAKASDFFFLLFPFIAGTILVSCKVLCTRHMGALFQYLDLIKCGTQVSVLRRNATKTQPSQLDCSEAALGFWLDNDCTIDCSLVRSGGHTFGPLVLLLAFTLFTGI